MPIKETITSLNENDKEQYQRNDWIDLHIFEGGAAVEVIPREPSSFDQIIFSSHFQPDDSEMTASP